MDRVRFRVRVTDGKSGRYRTVTYAFDNPIHDRAGIVSVNKNWQPYKYEDGDEPILRFLMKGLAASHDDNPATMAESNNQYLLDVYYEPDSVSWEQVHQYVLALLDRTDITLTLVSTPSDPWWVRACAILKIGYYKRQATRSVPGSRY